MNARPSQMQGRPGMGRAENVVCHCCMPVCLASTRTTAALLIWFSSRVVCGLRWQPQRRGAGEHGTRRCVLGRRGHVVNGKRSYGDRPRQLPIHGGAARQGRVAIKAHRAGPVTERPDRARGRCMAGGPGARSCSPTWQSKVRPLLVRAEPDLLRSGNSIIVPLSFFFSPFSFLYYCVT